MYIMDLEDRMLREEKHLKAALELVLALAQSKEGRRIGMISKKYGKQPYKFPKALRECSIC